MRFTLNIDSDNDAMQEVADIVRELRAVADQLEVQEDRDGEIIDPNGNTVGSFALTMACPDCGVTVDPDELKENATDYCVDCDYARRRAEERQYHLEQLQAIGYQETSLTPLLKVEAQAHSDAESYCDVEGFDHDAAVAVTMERVRELFGGEIPNGFFVNGDPRGFALKLREGTGSLSHRDWGGFEILAPDFD